MALFLKQTDQRSELQTKIAADIQARLVKPAGGDGKAPEPAILDDSKTATGRSLFWVGVAAMAIIALVVFMLFIFEG
ncbi:MAG TPA: hypothetical protein VFT87_01450 [Candidatus Saccharimonadales bacterium]|nr:hypothetical protein [Candidatus Saccharimonadales bacterium]